MLDQDAPILIIHPTCSSSYKLILELHSSGLLAKLRVLIASEPVYAEKYFAWSIPWLIVKGAPAVADPITLEEVEAVIHGEALEPRNPVEAFKEALLHSGYALSVVATWGDLNPVVTPGFVSAATRAPLTGISVAHAVHAIKEKSNEVLRELGDSIYRALAVTFTRDVWWASSGELTEDELIAVTTPLFIKAWLLARASIGRVGLPRDPRRLSREATEFIANFVSRNAKGLLSKVRSEQEKILGDKEYWRILSEIESKAPR